MDKYNKWIDREPIGLEIDLHKNSHEKKTQSVTERARIFLFEVPRDQYFRIAQRHKLQMVVKQRPNILTHTYYVHCTLYI